METDNQMAPAVLVGAIICPEDKQFAFIHVF